MNNWQQPDNNTPSVGNPHIHIANIVSGISPANTNPIAVDISGEVPVGTKLIYVYGYATDSGPGAGRNVRSYTTNGTDIFQQIGGSVGLTTANALKIAGFMPVTSDRKVYWSVNSTSIDDVTIVLLLYFL